jgi:nicotinamide mononucleotide adenylyltransferase
VIGIGSSNRYDVRNPFTPEESADMIRRVLGDRGRYSLIPVPDLACRATRPAAAAPSSGKTES